MVAVPEDKPVTIPVAISIYAIEGLLLLHNPPPASVKVVVAPTHTWALPVIAGGNGLTVTIVVAIHPVGNEKVMIAVPADTPVTTPVADPTVPMEVDPELQVPPPPSANVVIWPRHTKVIPVIVPGNGSTVTVVVAEQTIPGATE